MLILITYDVNTETAAGRTPSFLKDDGVCHKYSADTYLLQIYLYGKFDELLYILSDP